MKRHYYLLLRYRAFFLLTGLFFFHSASRSQDWSGFGYGVAYWVHACVVYNGELVVGGEAGSGIYANHINRWTGTEWDTLGPGLNGEVDALAVYNGDLIAGGRFINAGGLPVNFIARWDGTSWHDMEGGMNSIVSSLVVYDGKLIAAGYFTSADNPGNYIAQWDGHSWSALGSGMGGSQGQVMALTTYGTDLIAGGFFTTAGGVTANHLAKWNGTSWSELGGGANWIVYALCNYGSQLAVGGYFGTVGGVGGIAAQHVALWDGNNWSALGSGCGGGTYGYVFALTEYKGNLVAGGIYTTAGGNPAANIARWDGSTWHPMAAYMSSGGTVQAVFAQTVYNNTLVAGGIFNNVDGANAGNVAAWNGSVATGTRNNIIANVALQQNFPNPFRKTTRINYTVSQPGNVKLKVFDLLGQVKEILVNGLMKAGEYSIQFNAEDLPEGYYFYCLETDSNIENRKMQIIK